MEATMRWYHYVAYFFGGAFLANTMPHLGNGISGHPFQAQAPFHPDNTDATVAPALVGLAVSVT
jgi:hypothetical protein